ncbi:N-acetylglucosaminylaminotransferase [Naegleria gruberi]|uniref:N-acetylglucosaminylaminotransferase n=1 Tax=Naegleria gruberi TaxID=5762 RepID=D2UZX5_NAEGR|nr:N-acetylglucosaminylaminotransferase [Naegleria gruberi]EFC50011.1 N-acetylglucosaminylaminotransferase [Naegleria gruberi]|eukprot:XP_002682755.1 N-acetylglucosaminylaminotransferase [Naegleria gruberi strain NEG-M]
MNKKAKTILYLVLALFVFYVLYNFYIYTFLIDMDRNTPSTSNVIVNPKQDTPTDGGKQEIRPVHNPVIKSDATGKDQIYKISEYHPIYEQFVKEEIQSEYHPSSFIIAIVATKRPYYLEATLRSLQQVLYYNPKNTYIYQYGDDKVINQIARKYDISMIHNQILTSYEGRQLTEGAEHISLHYKYIIGHVFDNHKDVKHFIIVEDDMLFAPDFLLYFAQTAKFLHEDESIYAISAYNDNGMRGKVKYDNMVYRTDFMIGLGWLVSRRIWEKEWRYKWPRSHWDHFLRADNNRLGRQIIFPEVPRIYHSGYTGTHSTVALYERYFRNHLLNPNGFSPLGIARDHYQNGEYAMFDLERTTTKYTLEYLRKENYAKFIKHLLFEDPNIVYVSDPDTIINYQGKIIVIAYSTQNPHVNNEWVSISEYFELWHSTPIRDEYNGVMLFRWSDNMILIVGSYSPFYAETCGKAGSHCPAPISKFHKDSNWSLPKKDSIITFAISKQGQSCSSYCKQGFNMECYRFSFEEMNSCKFLRKFVGQECTECIPSSGPDQPAIDVDSKQCLFNGGGRGKFISTCEAYHVNTKRICPCFDEKKTIILREEWEDIIAQSQYAATHIVPKIE